MTSCTQARHFLTLAIKALAGLAALLLSVTLASAQTFSAPGSWSYVVPAGVNTIQVLVAGGGGGGAGAGSFNPSLAPGGAGGNGALITAIVQVTAGQTLSGTIGGGGITGYSSGSTTFGLVACTGSGAGGSGVGAGGRGANTNCNGAGASGGGGGGGGGTTFAVSGTVLLQAGGGGGGGAWGGGSAAAGTTSSALSISAICGFSAAGGAAVDFFFDGGGGGGGGGGYTAGLAGVSNFDNLPVGSGSGGGSCYSFSSAIKSVAISSSGGAGASGVPALTTSAGPAGGSGYVIISVSAVSVAASSFPQSDPVNSITNPKAIPVATMEHCFLVTNGWATTVTGMTIAIQIPSNQSYVTSSAKYGATCATATTAAAASYSAGTLTVTTASVAANASYAVVYRAIIS